MNTEVVLRKLDAIARLISELRSEIAEERDDQDPLADWRRIAEFLGHFADSPEGRIHVSRMSTLARSAGYTPQGINGFYTGQHPSLKTAGDFRVITDDGRELHRRAMTAVREG